MQPAIIVGTVNAAINYDPSEAIDQLFIVGFTEKGPLTPKRVFSLAEWEAIYGGAVEYSVLHAHVKAFYKEGGQAVVTARRVGPSPVAASCIAKNVSAAEVIKLEASGVGTYGNSLTRQFVAGAGGAVQLTIALGATVIAHSGDLTTQAAIVAYANAIRDLNGQPVVTGTVLGGSGLPVVDGAPVAFTGGTDDHTNSVDAQRLAALEQFDVRYGPGQVAAPGQTTEVAHDQLREHHASHDRVALLDSADSATATTITGALLPQRVKEAADGTAAFAPWVTGPDGVQVPPSAFVAAKIAAMDLATGNPNLPAAGVNGAANWITGLTQDYSPASCNTLDAGGVNAILNVDGLGNIQVFGYDTLGDPTQYPLTTALSNVRLDMLIRWKARKIGRTLILKEIDALGHLASKYAGDLDGMLKPFKGDGTIYGYVVDTQSVNNRQTASEKKLFARIGIQRTQYAKTVWLEVENHAITETL